MQRAWIIFTFGIGLAVGLLPTLGVAVFMGFTAALKRDTVEAEKLDEGRIASKQSLACWSLIFGPVVGLGCGLLAGLAVGWWPGIIYGSIVAIAVALGAWMDAGGSYLLLQRRVRRRAYREGLLPENPVGFIERAIEVRLLRKTGGGVQFRHRVIADRLAEEAPSSSLDDLWKARKKYTFL